VLANRWAPQGGACYCVHCEQNFKEATGGALPGTSDPRAANPDARFIPNGPPDLKTAGELAAIQFTDNQARHGLTPPWNNGRRAKELRSVSPPEDGSDEAATASHETRRSGVVVLQRKILLTS
jgi:hypothetical protein